MGAAVLLPATALAGCSLEIRPGEQLTPGGSPSQGSGEAGSGGVVTGGVGGAHAGGDFVLSIPSPEVEIVYEGSSFIDVGVTRLDELAGPIEVVVRDAPEGFVSAPLTIPEGAAGGRLLASALESLVPGSRFDLQLVATSGALQRSASVPAVVVGRPGTIDTSFGVAGKASWTLNSHRARLHDIHEADDGKILIAGMHEDALDYQHFLAARLLPDGALDTPFSNSALGGQVRVRFCSCTSESGARGVLRAPDGTVLLVGGATSDSEVPRDIGIVRLRDDGTPSGPANDGRTLLDLGPYDVAVNAAEPSGEDHFLVTGARNGQLFLARVGPHGLDTGGFAAPAGYTWPDVGLTSAGTALDIDDSGHVVVAGVADDDEGRHVVVHRVSPSGGPVDDGGLSGSVLLSLPSVTAPAGVAVQPDGRIVFVATISGYDSLDVLVARLDATGALDPTFGTGGWVVTEVSRRDETPVGLEVLEDGRILVGGNTNEGPFVARYLPDGALDPDFGDGGILRLHLGDSDVLHTMELGQGGKLLVAGTVGEFSWNPPDYKGVVLRIWN